VTTAATVICTHRGASAHHSGHSRAAFTAAIEMGVDAPRRLAAAIRDPPVACVITGVPDVAVAARAAARPRRGDVSARIPGGV
jgi:hypothetical protein